MIKLLLLLVLLTPSLAFLPANNKATTKLAATFDNEVGAQEPFGCWDPLGFCDNADQARFNRLRAVEIKHGRISMLAVVGHIVTAMGVRLPGYANVPAGLAAFNRLPLSTLLGTIGFIGFLDVLVMRDYKGTAEFAGDFRNGLFKWSADEEEKKWKREIEVNNGRAAMMGILGLMFHEELNDEPYVINSLLGYSSHFNDNFY